MGHAVRLQGAGWVWVLGPSVGPSDQDLSKLSTKRVPLYVSRDAKREKSERLLLSERGTGDCFSW